MADNGLVNLKINGVAIQAPAGEMVIEAAKRAGIDVPFFCYHPRLSMADGGANCRMCLVDVAMPRRNPDGTTVVAKFPKPQTACSLPVAEGMEIETENEQVVSDRRGILEFLLINHPLDCPICDRGGECPLQNNAIHYGPPTTRFIEEKRHFPKAYPLSQHVVFDRERCIHCARCTRFTSDVSGDHQLNFLFRSASMEVGTYNHTEFKSRFSGNVIELCPVGALLSRDYRFKARPWDLVTQKSLCTQCANGCNIKMDSRVSQLQRVNARENDTLNEEWTCDKGKFGMGYVSDPDRLTQPLIRKGGSFVPATWEEANDIIVSKLKQAGTAVGVIGGARTFNEDLYVMQRFIREHLKVNNIDFRMGPNFGPVNGTLFHRLGYRTMGNKIADLDKMKSVLVMGSNLVDEQPMLFLRVRRAAVQHGAKVIEALPDDMAIEDTTNHVGEFAAMSLRYRRGSESYLLAGLLQVLKATGKLTDPSQIVDSPSTDLSEISKLTGVTVAEIEAAAEALAVGSMAIIAGEAITSAPNRSVIEGVLADLALSTGNGGNVNLPVTVMNAQGALDLGAIPDLGPGYSPANKPGLNSKEILESAASGNLQFLWVVGADPVTEFSDSKLALRALEESSFTVVHAHSLNATAKCADVVLPVQTIAERSGTMTNVEGRVQQFHRAFELAQTIRADWRVFQQIGAQLGFFMPYFSDADITRDIAKNVPGYAGCTPDKLGDEGLFRSLL